jgi:LmbE family N-acetylglucosaminyl deacetylase
MSTTETRTHQPARSGAPGRLPAGTTLLAVWAHPDDEAYLAAGLMADVADRGGRVVCAFATRGEQGAGPGTATAAGRARLRGAEARRSLMALGVDQLRFLGHADGACDRVDPADGMAQVARLVHEVQPHTIVTFGSDGITGHPDHVAVSRWTIGAWTQSRLVGTPPELLLAATTEDFLARNAGLHRDIGLFGYGSPRATRDDEVTVRVALSEQELDRKRAALAAHESQTPALAAAMGEDRYRGWWREETFRSPTGAEVADAVRAVTDPIARRQAAVHGAPPASSYAA